MVEGDKSHRKLFLLQYLQEDWCCVIYVVTSSTGYKVEQHQRCDGEVDVATHRDYACLALV